MKEYNLSAKVTISLSTKVRAESLEEAIKIAHSREIDQEDFHGFRCEHSWVSSEFDGVPFDIQES